MKVTVDDLRAALTKFPRAGSFELCRRLNGINRSTLARLIAQFDREIIRRGGSKRIRYALRRSLRGQSDVFPLYRIDTKGTGHVAGHLELTASDGSALSFDEPLAWPLDAGEMSDGWFDGLPYPLLDMRPQGFIGRNFAHLHGQMLDVSEHLDDWSDDDVIHVLANYGHDQSGDLILGDRAYQRHLDTRRDWESRLVRTNQLLPTYLDLARLALARGIAGASAAGEFPKFTAMREINGLPVSVIVKFSGADDSPAVRRWADMLVCEHLALETLPAELGIAAASSTIHQHGGRTFLEVVRFDRHGAHGRHPLCSLASINGALIGKGRAPWPVVAEALHHAGWLDADSVSRIKRQWWFGKLIANTDMHEGNLSFHPGLTIAPAYDMLPMLYAPMRAGEVPPQPFIPALPLPRDIADWQLTADAAIIYWKRCAQDNRISEAFRSICSANAAILEQTLDLFR
jgi:hypothetical protein